MKPVQTVITAAGDSRALFLGAGFSTPKSLVERDGKTVLLRAIESYVVDFERAIVAINADEQDSDSTAASVVGEGLFEITSKRARIGNCGK